VTEPKPPQRPVGDLDADVAAKLVAAATDIALIVDDKGIIRDLAFHSDSLARGLSGYDRWLGRPWIQTVTVESRPKIEQLIRDADPTGATRWRQVNHPTGRGPDIPILYATIRTGTHDRIVAIGRDMRATAALQQKLVEAQQSMERDYAHLRHIETRYRLLFEMSSDAFLMLEASAFKVIEANPAAARLLGSAERKVIGRPFLESFDAESADAIETLFDRLRTGGWGGELHARLAGGTHKQVIVAASLFRQEGSLLFLVRVAPRDAEHVAPAAAAAATRFAQFLETAPDAVVITDHDGSIITANAAFLELAQLATEDQARSESLDRWLGRPGVDLSVLIAGIRQRGTVRLFATSVRGEHGAEAQVEISACAIGAGKQAGFGFAIRDVGRRLPATRLGRELPRSVEDVKELVGRVSLKELVRETTDIIERLAIEAALELTEDNRASAAEMLGLSRQSLYTKLRRYGIADLSDESGTQQ
jgi:transcriptional regulator PpsR